MSNRFKDFSTLPKELQAEAIREGERRLDAQLQIANAADARALAWGGLLIGAVTASLGASVALMTNSNPDYVLAFVALLFGGSLLAACVKALSTVEPDLFCPPGNDPAHWLPSEWNCSGTEKAKISVARAEQAVGLSDNIMQNASRAKQRALAMKASFRIARWTILIAGLALIAILVARAPPVQSRLFDGGIGLTIPG